MHVQHPMLCIYGDTFLFVNCPNWHSFLCSPNPALPQTPGLPPSRSGRPYTTFELDQIRQMHRG